MVKYLKELERFYNKVFYSLEYLRNRAKIWRKEYNIFTMKQLRWLVPTISQRSIQLINIKMEDSIK